MSRYKRTEKPLWLPKVTEVGVEAWRHITFNFFNCPSAGMNSICSWNCFDGACVLGFHSVFPLAKWTGCIRARRGARCRVVLKGNIKKPQTAYPLSAPCPGVERQWHVPPLDGSEEYQVSYPQIKTIIQTVLWEWRHFTGRRYMQPSF